MGRCRDFNRNTLFAVTSIHSGYTCNSRINKGTNEKKMRLKWKPYFAPTPKRVRILGDSLAAASIFVAGLNIDSPKIMITCAIVGGVGKFISNFIDA